MPSDARGDGVVHPEPRKGPFQGPSLRTRRLEEFTSPLLFRSRRVPGGQGSVPPSRPPVGLDAHRTAAHSERGRRARLSG